jgi:large subunit ribosomal protein L32e
VLIITIIEVHILSDLKRLSKIRALKKKQQPTFRAQNSWRFKRVSPKWRKPRGIDSKMREKLKGHPKMVNVGYRKPKLLRDMYFSDKLGLREEFQVSSIPDLDLVLPHKHIVRIDGNLGARKKEKIFQEAVSWGLHVINPITAKEEFDETDLTEDLSLDRDLGLDLDLDDIEENQDDDDESLDLDSKKEV